MSSNLDERRNEVRRAYRDGRLAEAMSALAPIVDGPATEVEAEDYKLLGLIHFASGQFEAAAQAMTAGHKRWPDDPEFAKNIGLCLSRAPNRRRDAIEWLDRAAAREPDDANLFDALANVWGELGDLDKARINGRRALEIKDGAAAHCAAAIDLDQVSVPPFNPQQPSANVIAFSLWGQAERYCEGAIRNAQLGPVVFPEWRCRFYIDASVPERVRAELLAAGADVVLMPNRQRLYEGLFWRFLVANDPNVERFLIRDADSVFSIKERLAVDDWIRSGAHFHMMRDTYTHTATLLAGLWGGVRNAVPAIGPLIDPYLNATAQTRTVDQLFLQDHIWPIARQSCCTHDDFFDALGSKAFPSNAHLPAGHHVGQNEAALEAKSAGRYTVADGSTAVQPRQTFIFTITTGRSGTAYLSALLRANLSDAEIYHERTGFDALGVHNPDASHFTQFNSAGNVAAVREFWRRKQLLIRDGVGRTYAETSHYLCKAGLIENLGPLAAQGAVHLIALQRDVFDTVWSFANRFDFYNLGFTWLFALDPRYPRVLVDPEPLREHGMLGACLWYVAEMRARTEYYRLLLEAHARVHVHVVSLESIKENQGAVDLLSTLDPSIRRENVELPAAQNTTASFYLGDDVRRTAQSLVERYQFNVEEIARTFYENGRRL